MLDEQFFRKGVPANWMLEEEAVLIDNNFSLGSYRLSWIKANAEYRLFLGEEKMRLINGSAVASVRWAGRPGPTVRIDNVLNKLIFSCGFTINYVCIGMNYRDILLIDDDEEDHEIFQSALARLSDELHYTALTNPREALDKLIAKELNPDVIFLDLNMAIMSGQEFLMQIKKEKGVEHIPVIIYSTTSNPVTIKRTKEIGAVDFITKPDRFSTLVDILKPIII